MILLLAKESVFVPGLNLFTLWENKLLPPFPYSHIHSSNSYISLLLNFPHFILIHFCLFFSIRTIRALICRLVFLLNIDLLGVTCHSRPAPPTHTHTLCCELSLLVLLNKLDQSDTLHCGHIKTLSYSGLSA